MVYLQRLHEDVIVKSLEKRGVEIQPLEIKRIHISLAKGKSHGHI